jgi:hypothetical protein
MKSILDPSFKYTPSVNTDIRKTFERVRKDNKNKEKKAEAKRDVVFLKSVGLVK